MNVKAFLEKFVG
jgi:hypothetical protein